MTRLNFLAACFTVILMSAGAAVAGDNGTVKNYLGATVRTYDASGESTGEKPVKDLPPLPFDIDHYDSKGHVVATINKKTYYLKASDLVIRGNPVCKNLIVANRGYDTHTLAGPGVHAGAAETAVPCTH